MLRIDRGLLLVVRILLCGLLLAGAANAGTAWIDLYADSNTTDLPSDPTSAPSSWIATIGFIDDASVVYGDTIYTVFPTGISLSAFTRYWIGLSSFDGSHYQWDYSMDDSGDWVAGEGYYDTTYGWADNAGGAFHMQVITTGGTDPNQFDSTGAAVIDSVLVTHGPLYASFSTGDTPGDIYSVAVELYTPVPEPAGFLLLGTGLCALLAWRRRAAAIVPLLAIALAVAPRASAQIRPVTQDVSRSDAAAALGYWTPEQMAKAIPYPVPETGAGKAGSASVPRLGTSGVQSITPGFDRAYVPASIARAGALRPHTPVIPAGTGTNCDCTDPACRPYQSTFYVPESEYVDFKANLPYRAVGKVYFTMMGRNYACSGASIGGSAVITAGHCVSNGRGVFHTNWVFVPQFDNYHTPVEGPWAASQFLTFPEFHNRMDVGRDVGFAIVQGPKPNLLLSEYIGNLGFAWNQNPTGIQWSAFGYPSVLGVWDGVHMVQLVSTTACRDPQYTPAPMGTGGWNGAGGSGGPWVRDFRPTLTNMSLNYVAGISSYIGTGTFFSPYFDQAVKDLKDKAVAIRP